MRFSQAENKIREKIESVYREATPGLQLQVYLEGQKAVSLQVGETFAYYDLASLTKIIFSVQGMMWAFEQGKWKPETKVQEILPWYPHQTTKIIELLNHSSGLPWWLDFYRQMDQGLTTAQKWNQALELIRQTELASSSQSVYSDVGFMVLGALMESFFDRPLFEVWNLLSETFYERSELHFNLNNIPQKKVSLYAPTERCPWRGKLLQGEVHDDNAWALGGVAPHAGLFGSIDDVGWYLLGLRSLMRNFAHQHLKPKTVKYFTSRARPDGKGDWALGFMLASREGSTSGRYFSPVSVGHTGFTGTSLWYDPERDLGIILLSNRVYFGREVEEFKKIRPQIHNWVMEELRKA